MDTNLARPRGRRRRGKQSGQKERALVVVVAVWYSVALVTARERRGAPASSRGHGEPNGPLQNSSEKPLVADPNSYAIWRDLGYIGPLSSCFS